MILTIEEICQHLGWTMVPKTSERLGKTQQFDLLDRIEIIAAKAAAAERERCAKICEQLQDWPENATPDDCAKAIRAGR